MRFEEPVSNLVARYPELRRYDRGAAIPRAINHEISSGIVRGRRLRAEFYIRATKAVIVKPVVASGRFFARSLISVVQTIISDWKRRDTIKVLSALDDRILRDIGIDRGDIPYFAASMTIQSQRRKPAVVSPIDPTPSEEIFEPARAA